MVRGITAGVYIVVRGYNGRGLHRGGEGRWQIDFHFCLWFSMTFVFLDKLQKNTPFLMYAFLSVLV